MLEPMRVGVVGCGAISGAYLRMAPNFPVLEISALADLERAKAEARAEEFGIERVLGVDELLADESIELVLNLTIPKAHAPLCRQALEQGKHAFTEKPLGIDRVEGRRLLETAARTGRRVGCAPDTFLGAGLQTARQVIDQGRIGLPLAFHGYTMSRGHESWHGNPRFFYEPGGGPMFDMGPYYLTALLNLLGPVRRYSAGATIAIPDRLITSEPHHGEAIRVETPDHVCAVLEFENGALGTLLGSFATAHATYDRRFPLTVYGSEGTLRVPDPNTFDGEVQVRGNAAEEWEVVPPAFQLGYGRAVGLADLATAIRGQRPHRCSLSQAFGVLDLMQGFLDASQAGEWRTPEETYERPRPMPAGLPFGELD